MLNFFFENRAVVEVMWENMVQSVRSQVKNNMGHGLYMLDN